MIGAGTHIPPFGQKTREATLGWCLSVLLHLAVVGLLLALTIFQPAAPRSAPRAAAPAPPDPVTVDARRQVSELLQTEKQMEAAQAAKRKQFRAWAKQQTAQAPARTRQAVQQALQAQRRALQAQAAALKLQALAGKLAQTAAKPPPPAAQPRQAHGPRAAHQARVPLHQSTPKGMSQAQKALQQADKAQQAAQQAQKTAAEAHQNAVKALAQMAHDAPRSRQRAADAAQKQALAQSAQDQAAQAHQQATARLQDLAQAQTALQKAAQAAQQAQARATQAQKQAAAAQKQATQHDAARQRAQASLAKAQDMAAHTGNPEARQRAQAAAAALQKAADTLAAQAAKAQADAQSKQSAADSARGQVQQAQQAQNSAQSQVQGKAQDAGTALQTAQQAQQAALKAQADARQAEAQMAQAVAEEAAPSGKQSAASSSANPADSPLLAPPSAVHASRMPAELPHQALGALYGTAVESEKRSAALFQQTRAMEGAMRQNVPIEQALDQTSNPAPLRPALSLPSIGQSDTPGSADPQAQAALSEIHSMVALGRRMRGSLAGHTPPAGANTGLTVSLAGSGGQAQRDAPHEAQAAEDEHRPAKDLTGLTGGVPGPKGRSVPFDPSKPPLGNRPGPNLPAGPTLGDIKPIAGRRVQPGEQAADWMFVDSWYCIGPFPNPGRANIDKPFPPETLVDLDATYPGKDNRSVSWRFHQSATAEVVPPNPEEYAIWYFYTELWFDQPEDLWIAIGSDDKSNLWLNDQLVWVSSDQLKGWRIDEGLRRVHFRKGLNRMLLRLENGWRSTAMSVVIDLKDHAAEQPAPAAHNPPLPTQQAQQQFLQQRPAH